MAILRINQQFDAGNIEVLALTDPQAIRLAIRKDTQSDFFQWFHFRVSGVREQPLRMTIENAGKAAFPDGWEGYQAVASYDLEDWFRVATQYADGQLSIELTPEQDAVYFAYFAPYSLERHRQLIAMSQAHPACQLMVIGDTLQGRELDLLQIGEPLQAKQRVWITARQHPGESMAEWLVEGLLERLLDDDDALAERLLQDTVFYIVPNMNPDGSALGNLRTNAGGVNLNRVWGLADSAAAPEVYYVSRYMEQVGCDLFLDIHGDESIPYNFIAGQLGAPHVSTAILEQEATFKQRLMAVNPDFQLDYGYAPDRFGPEMMTLANFWAGQRFGIPAMVLEMPFKDNQARPDPVAGWSAERSKKLGASLLGPIAQHFC